MFSWSLIFCIFSLDKVLIFQKGKSLIQEWHHDIITILQLSDLSKKAFVVETKPNQQKKQKRKKVFSVGNWYTLTQLIYHEVNLNREIVKPWREPGQLSFLFQVESNSDLLEWEPPVEDYISMTFLNLILMQVMKFIPFKIKMNQNSHLTHLCSFKNILNNGD